VSLQNGSICRFGVFELDLKTAELRKNGIRLRLQDQPYQVLLQLIQRNGEIVTREELRSALWHRDTFVDFETGLNSAIKRVRETLGDSADNPKFIETLPRRGYRFIAPVEWPAAKGNGTSRSGTIQRSSSPRLLLKWTCGITAITVIILIWLAILRSQPRLPLVVSTVRITNDGKTKISANPFAVEGGNLYFIEGEPFTSGSGIAQVSAKGGETSWIETSLREPVAILSVSPVRPEMMVARFAGSDNGPLVGQVWVQPLPAGSPHRLGNLFFSSVCWTPDGSHILYADQRNTLFIANPDLTQPRELAKLPGPAWNLRFSPDGRRLRFSLYHPPDMDLSSMWEMDADGKNIHPLFPEWKNGPFQCCGNWSPDGKYYYFQTGRGPTEAIWVLTERRSLFGKTTLVASLLTSEPPLQFGAPTPSPDGKTLFVVGEDSRVELFRYGLSTRRFDPFLPGFSAGPVSFSADGKWMAYTSYPELNLWRSRIDGSDKMQLTFPPVRAYGARWSPDGSQIVFMDVQFSRPWKSYLISSSGGIPERLTRENVVGAETDPMWTPDGKSIIFGTQGADKNETSIHKLELKTRNASPIQDSAGQQSPRISPDGRYIAAFNSSQTELRLFDIKTNRWSSLASGEMLSYNEWSHDGRYVYMRLIRDGSGEVVRVRVKDRKLEYVLSLKDFPMLTDLWANWTGLTPDDAVLLMRNRSVQEIYALKLQFR
jgi:Tol biopolymer transport system component/DNA-binding winged helix-turn-helix (wHTH) protein